MTRWVLILLILTLLPAIAHAQVTPPFELPQFGDPNLLPVPEGDGRISYSSGPTDDTRAIPFPRQPGEELTYRSITASGTIKVSYRRDATAALQAACNSLSYQRSSAGPDAEERFTLAGNVILATPEGSLACSQLTIVLAPGIYEAHAHGAVRALFANQWLTADDAYFDYSAQTGILAGGIALSLVLEPELSDTAPANGTARPILGGVDFKPQAIRITGERLEIAFTESGLEAITSYSPVTLLLEPTSGGDPADSVTIICQALDATFAEGLAAGQPGVGTTRLSRFEAPRGIRLEYAQGVLEAGRGLIDIDGGELEFAGGVRVVQADNTVTATAILVHYNDAGQVRVEATGRPTFRISSSEFAPLTELLDRLRP